MSNNRQRRFVKAEEPTDFGRKEDTWAPYISKEDICMLLALFMEKAPFRDPELRSHTGVVIRRANQTILAMDVTRQEDLHPAMLLTTKFASEMKGAEIFMSRPPCATCIKVIVQSGIKSVRILPRSPEKLIQYKLEETVDNKATTSKEVPQAVNDPNGEENRITTKEILHHFVVKNIELKIHIPNLPETSRSDKADSSSKEEEDEKKEEDEKADLYIFKYCHSEIEDVQKSHTKGINAAKKWLRESTNEVKKKYWELHSAKNKTNVERNSAHFEVIFFFLKMCRILFERADDIKRSVGAVLLRKPGTDIDETKDDDPSWNEIEILSPSWNGYPRDSAASQYPTGEGKRSFMLHAEQNALIFRNSMDTTNMIAVVTKEPCKECKPVLRYLGTRRMYYPEDKKQTPNDKSNSSKNANDYFIQKK